MTFKTAVDNLVRTYEKYGFSRSEIEEQMKDGVMNQGFSVNVAYNGIRMTLAHVTSECRMQVLIRFSPEINS